MLGPFYLDWDRDALDDYLAANPTAAEDDCLQDFFNDVQRSGSRVPYQTSGEFFVVATCGFVLHLRDTADNGTSARVEKIMRPGMRDFWT
jgi:hypothetical protein